MGRKTNTIVAFLVALTCVTRSNGKRYADRSDQDPSTYFQPAYEDNVFVSGVDEMAKTGEFTETALGRVEDNPDELIDETFATTDVPPNSTFATRDAPPISESAYTGYRRSAYKGNPAVKKKPPALPPTLKIPTLKYDASSRYTSAFKMDTITDSDADPPEYSEHTNVFVPARVPAADAVPLKGILRKEPWPVKSANTKKVQIRKRVSVLFYDPKDGTVSKRPIGAIQKCGTFDDCPPGLGQGRFKSTRSLKQGLRHLFYQ